MSLVDHAKQQHQQQDFDGMCRTMVQIVQQNPKLGPEERHMLYISYKCAAGKRRQQLQQNRGDAQAAHELQTLCGELINVLSQTLIPNAIDTEAKVFFYKVMGDFYRYYDEVQPSQQNKDAALQCYQTASDWGASGLEPTNPLRLNVALNYGVCCQENMGNAQKGFDITNSAIDAARASLPTLPEQQRGESSMVLKMLFDNAKMWAQQAGRPQPADIQGLFIPPQQGGAGGR